MLTALREHESVRKAMLIQSDEHATLELSGKLTHYRIRHVESSGCRFGGGSLVGRNKPVRLGGNRRTVPPHCREFRQNWQSSRVEI
jgi:hypothetical protein